ncbi:MAG: hypothetical protein ABJE10_23775 [bacterium]
MLTGAQRVAVALVVALLTSCASSSDTAPRTQATRSYRMGFSYLPPRLTIEDVLRTADSVSRHSDGLLINLDIPWATLLAGGSAAQSVRQDVLPLAQVFQQKGIPIVATLDVANGIDRSAESRVLDSLGRSITDPAVQRVYRDYVVAFDSIIHPTWLALAMETNLIRLASPPKLYSAVVTMTNAAAQQLRATGSTTKLMVSVQVETAWGRPGNTFVGIQRDRTDFPFVQGFGLSSYPYLGGFAAPEQIPLEYYSKLVADAPLPMMVTEGGWTSASVPGAASSLDLQARYIRRQMAIADNAQLLGVYQITFTDLDLASFHLPPGTILPLFAFLGMEDTSYKPKPALAVWDSVRAVPLAH